LFIRGPTCARKIELTDGAVQPAGDQTHGTAIALVVSHMIEVGQTVGNYRITAKLGEGGMGMVFRAEHPVIGRRAALKAIHPEFAVSAEVISRFVYEAKAISQIGHEHIVDVTDFGRTPEGDFYFIMEYLSGEALAEGIHRDAPMEPGRALAIAAQIADALGASHAHGIVHRDLKPENVFLISRAGTRDFVKVLDFGLAKLVNGDPMTARETSAGMIMGTPYYMAPEQCEGRAQVDHRADIYALGVMLFEMVTGKVPFGGDSSGEILLKQVSMRAPAARALVPDLPEALDVLLHRALAKNPDDRFQSMEEFRAALLDPTGLAGAAPTAILEDLSGRVRAARPMARADVGPRPPGTRTTFREGVGAFASEPDLELSPARNRGRTWVAIAGAALAGVVLAVTLPRLRPSEETSSAVSAAPRPTIRVTFGSDPSGAEIVGADGRAVGTTPLSIELTPNDAAAHFVFRKDGFVPKTISIIPNVSSPVFAILEAVPSADPPPLVRARAAPRATRQGAPRLARRASGHEDDVLSPTFH
jgi:tRNA A-37 threonylcarbamoyl transferase component Bud32